MFGRDRVNKIQYHFHSHRVGNADSEFPPLVIVPFVGNARFTNAVGKHPFDEEPVHGGRIVFESVDPAGDETQRSLGDFFGHQPDPLPRILLQLADAFFEVRTRNQLNAFESRVIHPLRHREHHPRAHVFGPKTLMAVTNGGINESNGVHVFSRSM